MPGFKEKFVDKVARGLFCPLCRLPMKDAVQISSCGHLFCDTCLQEYLSEGIFKCPEDSLPLDYAKIYPAPDTDKEIMSSMVRCKQYKDGCRWTDQLANLQAHLDICRYNAVSCPNKCQAMISKMCLQDHLQYTCIKRRVLCEYCDLEFSGESYEAHHGACQSETVWCENKCGAMLERRFLGNHMRNECHKRLSPCRFCGKEFVYETLQTHQYSCPRFPVTCPNRCDLSKIPRDEVDLHIQDFCPSTIVTCTFKDYGCPHKCPRHILEKHLEENSKSHLTLMCRVVHRQQQQINSLRSKVHTIANVTDGILVWKIPDYKGKFAEARSKSGLELMSEPFYTSRYGYKLVASVFLNGNGSGEGKFLSLYIKLIPGEYDNILEWPFTLPMSFSLIDQCAIADRVNVRESFVPDPTWKHFQKPTKEETSLGFGYPKFISHEALKSRSYIKDDCLFMKIKVNGKNTIPF